MPDYTSSAAPLLVCGVCGSAVGDVDKHNEWHEGVPYKDAYERQWGHFEDDE